jgi:hypothetical protein
VCHCVFQLIKLLYVGLIQTSLRHAAFVSINIVTVAKCTESNTGSTKDKKLEMLLYNVTFSTKI